MKPFLIAISICTIAVAGFLIYIQVADQKSLPILIQIDTLTNAVDQVVDQVVDQNPIRSELKRRSNGCSEEKRTEFVKKARSINGAFKDNYYLAIGTSKIALSPVVLEMQKLKREMEDLETDDCGKPAHDALADAYDKSIDVFLDFMQERPNVFDPKEALRDATTQLEAYAIDIAGAILMSDVQIVDKLDKSEALTAEIAYLEPMRSMNNKDDCEKIRDTLIIAVAAMGSGWKIYPLIDGFDANDLDIDKIDACGKFTEDATK